MGAPTFLALSCALLLETSQHCITISCPGGNHCTFWGCLASLSTPVSWACFYDILLLSMELESIPDLNKDQQSLSFHQSPVFFVVLQVLALGQLIRRRSFCVLCGLWVSDSRPLKSQYYPSIVHRPCRILASVVVSYTNRRYPNYEIFQNAKGLFVNFCQGNRISPGNQQERWPRCDSHYLGVETVWRTSGGQNSPVTPPRAKQFLEISESRDHRVKSSWGPPASFRRPACPVSRSCDPCRLCDPCHPCGPCRPYGLCPPCGPYHQPSQPCCPCLTSLLYYMMEALIRRIYTGANRPAVVS